MSTCIITLVKLSLSLKQFSTSGSPLRGLVSYTLAEESQNTLSAARSLVQSRAPEPLSLK